MLEDEVRAYITLVRSRTTNTMAEWNLMIDAEQILETHDPEPAWPEQFAELSER